MSPLREISTPRLEVVPTFTRIEGCKIRRSADIILDTTSQPVPKIEIQTDIITLALLPTQDRVRVLVRSITDYPFAIHEILIAGGISSQRLVTVARFTTRHTVRETRFEALQYSFSRLHELRRSHLPCNGSRGEITPTALDAEFRTCLAADRGRDKQHVMPIIIHATEESEQRVLAFARPHGRQTFRKPCSRTETVPERVVKREIAVLRTYLLPIVPFPRGSEHELERVITHLEIIIDHDPYSHPNNSHWI